MDRPERTVSYWPRWRRRLLNLTFCLLLAAGCLWIIDAALFDGMISGTSVDLRGRKGVHVLLLPILGICILAYYIALFAFRLARWQPSLKLTPEGITLRPFYESTRFVGWDEISEVSIFDYRLDNAPRRYGLGIGLHDPDRYLKRLGFLDKFEADSNAKKIGFHLYVSTALVSEPLEDVQKTMQRFLERSRQVKTPAVEDQKDQ